MKNCTASRIERSEIGERKGRIGARLSPNALHNGADGF